MAKRKEGEVLPDYILWTYSKNYEGKHPVKLRITHQRKREYFQILTSDRQKVFLTQEEFDFVTKTAKPKLRKDNRALREVLDGSVDAAKESIKEVTLNGKKPFSIVEFKKKFLGEDANKNFLTFFKNHIEKLEKNGQAGTVRSYQNAYAALKTFQNDKDFDPSELTPAKLYEFDNWLRNEKKGKVLNGTSVGIYMRTIRSIYNEIASTDSYLQSIYPFSRTAKDGKYKVPSSTGQKGQTMTKDELISFINGKVEGEAMHRAKQLFLFSLYGQGANFKDLALLKYENVGKDYIEFERQKTIRTKSDNRKIQIPLTDELKEILVEQGNPDKQKTNYIFEVFEPKRTYTPKQMDDAIRQLIKVTNKWLKRYCKLNGLSIITTYAARHTFASLAKTHLSVTLISQMLGHAKISTTQTYLGRFEDSENRAGLMKVFEGINTKSA